MIIFVISDTHDIDSNVIEYLTGEAVKIKAEMTITVDGIKQAPVTIQQSDIYTLFDSRDYKDHVMEIEISQPGFQTFTFTFG